MPKPAEKLNPGKIARKAKKHPGRVRRSRLTYAKFLELTGEIFKDQTPVAVWIPSRP